MRLLTEATAEDFLELEGFDVARRRICTSLESAKTFAQQIGYPVVLKVASEHLTHKSDINSVRVHVMQEDIEKTFKELEQIKVQKQGILVQEYKTGKEVLVGIKKNPTFGHVIVYGMGGIYTEIMQDVSLRIAPVTKTQAQAMVHELKAHKILEGFRGHKVNIKEIIKLIMQLNKLSEKYPHIQELDINPVIVNDSTATIVDARVIFED